MAFTIDAPEYLVIDAIPLSTPAWVTTNMDDLISTSEVRGSDLLVPMGDGVRPQRRRATVTAASIELAVFGDTAPDGTPQSDLRAGLRANLDILASLADTEGTRPDGTRVATLHLSGVTRTGPVHVLRVRFTRESAGFATVQMELSLPTGALA